MKNTVKRSIFSLVAILMICCLSILSLTSCGSEPTQNAPESAVRSGKVLALGAPELSGFPSEISVGTQKELDKWTDLIKSGNIASIAVNSMNDSESELSTETARSILKILIDADLKLYDRLGNPMTGGAIHILAYDSSGTMLFHSVYNGEWFSVAFKDENTAYAFNGEGGSLDELVYCFQDIC